MANLAIGDDVIGPHEIQVIDLGGGNKLVNFDGSSGFERDILQLVLRDFQVGIRVDLVALDDVFVRDLVAGFASTLR